MTRADEDYLRSESKAGYEGRSASRRPISFFGIDPAGNPSRPTGIAVITCREPGGCRVSLTGTVKDDEDVLFAVSRYRPLVVAIDAPLGTSGRGYRMVDREALRRGYRLLPPSWRGMRMLVERSARLAAIIVGMGVEVIETHPRSALKSAGCGYGDWERCISRIINLNRLPANRHEIDALIAACVALEYYRGKAPSISSIDGSIYLLPAL